LLFVFFLLKTSNRRPPLTSDMAVVRGAESSEQKQNQHENQKSEALLIDLCAAGEE
jgi:hypothetical protein